mmetsp:Transcript_32322/g.77524  ORF Transcript_32322/g.77524 Transcript_32322/m.77524 type:complete len:151 (-) Transcript_32322:191-643(-)
MAVYTSYAAPYTTTGYGASTYSMAPSSSFSVSASNYPGYQGNAMPTSQSFAPAAYAYTTGYGAAPYGGYGYGGYGSYAGYGSQYPMYGYGNYPGWEYAGQGSPAPEQKEVPEAPKESPPPEKKEPIEIATPAPPRRKDRQRKSKKVCGCC